jgi:hypothetical protein
VFLVHGIRTQAEWQQTASHVLEQDSSIRVVATRYEFFDLGRFLLPIPWLRKRPVARLVRLLRDEHSNPRTSRISVIAHSFGTWAVCKVLETEPDIKFDRLIFCGSVVPDSFEWERYGHRLAQAQDSSWQVVNDCGHLDVWPVFAQSLTWGYGSSGRFGFGHNRVKDRFHRARHSEFFSESFVRHFWLPFLSSGTVVNGLSELPPTSWLLSLLTVAKLKYAILVFLMAVMSFGAYKAIPSRVEQGSGGAAVEDPIAAVPTQDSLKDSKDSRLTPVAIDPTAFRAPSCADPPTQPNASPPLECVEVPDAWRTKGLWNLALLRTASASSSSSLSKATAGYHRTEYLNDGWYNNGRSWVPAEADNVGHCAFPVWAEIDLGAEFSVHVVALTNELRVLHRDRGATMLSIEAITSQQSTFFASISDGTALRGRREFPVPSALRARRIRVTITAAEGGSCPRLDEIEVLGTR